MQYSACNYHIEHHVATITLNRPDKGNALNEQMIAELTQIVAAITDDIHVILLQSAGKHFCTGADLQEMQQEKSNPLNLALLLKSLHELNVPIVARVQGAAFAGAMGLLANSDIVIAESSAQFCLSEVKLGLIPAMISPYIIEAIGLRNAKKIMLTAEKFSATQALGLGLVHQVVDSTQLDTTVTEEINHLLANSRTALRAVKKLCREVMNIPTSERPTFTADLLTNIRSGQEAQARLKAFFEKNHV